MTHTEFKQTREERGISQTLLGVKSNVPGWKISRWEKTGKGLELSEKERVFGALAVIPEMTQGELSELLKGESVGAA